MTPAPTIPYCGPPPVPGSLAWNTDPILIAGFVAVGALYAWGCGGPHGPDRRAQASFAAGWLIAAAALLSPLCHLSVALFSARVAQHVVLALVAAPLIALGRPGRAFARLRPDRPGNGRTASGSGGVVLAAVLFAAALWTWHLPGPYDATLGSDLVYWTMHLTTFGAALLLWHVLMDDGAFCPGSALLAAFATAVQMSLLGALLTVAPRPLFAVHAGTTWPWGLSILEDQQLGGLIMWVPGGLLFTLYGVVAFGLWLHRIGSRPAPDHALMRETRS